MALSAKRLIIKRLIVSLFFVVLGSLAGFYYYAIRDPYSKTITRLDIRPPQQPLLRVGFSARKITPQLPDSWVDHNKDGRYNPEDGDSFTDGNNNGKLDRVWLAGYHNNRPAAGIHDDLWARTVVFDDGQTRLAFTAIDAIGLFLHDVEATRQLVNDTLRIDYLAIHATHVHSAPDLMGLWGQKRFRSGVDKAYLKFVQQQIALSAEDAVRRLRPARLRFAVGFFEDDKTQNDTRHPVTPDPYLFVMHALDKESGNPLGSIVQWSNHPETMGSNNLLITSDFPHYVREGMEIGYFHDTLLHTFGPGGISIYANGALGGLMTTRAETAVPDPFGDSLFVIPSVAKIRAQGYRIAREAQKVLETQGKEVENAGIRLKVQTLFLPIDNPLFRWASLTGLMGRGMSGWMKKRSEIAGWQIGPASFATLPGEMYPEMVNGGVLALRGNDFNLTRPVEDPSMRRIMPGEFKFIFGTTNDEIGYVIPKSQWDAKPPYSFRSKPQYGEENSLGPETGPLLHRAFVDLWKALN
ncbi:MAG: hypothetical protein AB7C90_04480 [Bacteroidales bacterium]